MPGSTALTETEVRRMEIRITEYLKNLAVRKGIVKDINDALVRDLMPSLDLGASTENWSQTLATANAFNTVYSLRLPDKKAIVIYGVRIITATPRTTAIRFALGPDAAKVKDVISIEPAYTSQEREIIFETPILYEDSQYVHISFFARSTGTDRIVLLGKVVEPSGEVISQ